MTLPSCVNTTAITAAPATGRPDNHAFLDMNAHQNINACQYLRACLRGLPRGLLGLVSALLLTLPLSGCSSMKIDDFAQQQPPLVLEDYFAGDTWAWGFFSDRFGNIKRRFSVTLQGRVEDNVLTLTEDFIYDDGQREQRVWQIRPSAENQYQGSAADVIGNATGTVAGNALNWQYQMYLTIGARRVKVHFDDWMLLQPDGVLLNQATVSKWGITLGRVNIFFSKTPPRS